MMSSRFAMVAFMFAFVVAAVMLDTAEAAYRKPPFNGSIFGKRNGLEYDSAKAFSALCEVALEACQTFYPSAENK